MIQDDKTAVKKASTPSKKKGIVRGQEGVKKGSKKSKTLQKGKASAKTKKASPKKTTKKAQAQKKKTTPKKSSSFKNAIKQNLESVKKMKDFEDLRVEKIAFGIFLSFPKKERGTLADFTNDWGISEVTLWRWKSDPDVNEIKMMFLKSNFKEWTEDAFIALRHNITNKNPLTGLYHLESIKYWMKILENIDDAQKVDVKNSGEIQVIFNSKPSHFIQPTDEK